MHASSPRPHPTPSLALPLLATLAIAAGAFAAPVRAQGGVVSRDSAITVRIGQRGRVRGIVRDSLAGVPLAGAIVQLVSADSATTLGLTVETDSLGSYEIAGVPVGRYTLGFHHPRLDSIGLEPPLRAVEVGSISDVRADLAIPSATRLRAIICGGNGEAPRGGAMLMGFVRRAEDLTPVTDALVEAAWLEVRIDRQGIGNRLRRQTQRSGVNGWFAFCDVPAPGTIALQLVAGTDTLDTMEFEMSGVPFERRELLVGASSMRTTVDSVRIGDSLVVRPRTLRVGRATVRGAVVRADNGRPLANAQVAIVNGPSTRTNARGEWMITEAPAGTRTLDVRAVGYFPVRLTTTITDNGSAPLIALSTTFSVLETVKVRARYWRYADLKGFRTRQKSGLGRFYTPRDIAARAAKTTTELLRSMSGVLVEFNGNGEPQFYQKTPGAIGEDRCIPTVYLNGSELRNIDATTLDTFVNPDRVVGIEIYQAGMAPAAFQAAFSGCGAIVVWTR